MLETIRKKNPHVPIQHVQDEGFARYGRLCSFDATDIIKYTRQEYEIPVQGSTYSADMEQLHEFTLIKDITHSIYGNLPIEVGLCHGQNDTLTGLEYHMGSEVNIAITPCLLALGRVEDMENKKISAKQLEVFYIPAGTILELYETTLHYCPFSCNQNGFSTIVLLLDKTNTEIPYQRGELLTKRNKWFITHTSNMAKVEAGNVVGLVGPLLHIEQ